MRNQNFNYDTSITADVILDILRKSNLISFVSEYLKRKQYFSLEKKIRFGEVRFFLTHHCQSTPIASSQTNCHLWHFFMSELLIPLLGDLRYYFSLNRFSSSRDDAGV